MLLDQPLNKYYLSVVHSAMQDPDIMKQYNLLEQSLSNPQVLEQIINDEMLHSTTRRVSTESFLEQQAKKNIERTGGPNDSPSRGNEMMRGTKYAS